MSFGFFLNQLNIEERKSFQKLVGLCKKKIKQERSIKYLEICMKNHLWPHFTNIKVRDQAVKNKEETTKYRIFLLQNEIDKNSNSIDNIKQLIHDLTLQIDEKFTIDNVPESLISELNCHKDIILKKAKLAEERRFANKIKALQNKQQCSKDKENFDCFVNLSSYALTDDEKKFLNLGLNFHIENKYDQLNKQTEIEVLYQDILRRHDKNEIEIHANLADELRREGKKNRHKPSNSVLTSELRATAKNLKSRSDIIIRKTDKASCYAILNTSDYYEKLDDILNDDTKFKRIKKDTTNDIKIKANKLITANNALIGGFKLDKIIGDFSPGYIYGTVKTHKPGNPLRPIISQIPSPVYEISKKLNEIISKYIPDKYIVKSTTDFIDLLDNCENNNGIIASLDAESLFTNVPVKETINIIEKRCYNHPTLAPPSISPNILKELLFLCTTGTIFRDPRNNLYQQIDGVAMGSPLGPTFSNFYMGNLENTLFDENNICKPPIYCRFVDDIFILSRTEDEVKYLKNNLEKHSVLKFSIENNVNHKLPFLDILVDNEGHKFNTKVYRKTTNIGLCMDGRSECPERYKKSVITSYLNRAHKVSTTKEDLEEEIKYIRTMLGNNNYSNKMIDKEIDNFKNSKNETNQDNLRIKLFFKAQFHQNYFLDEKILKNIIKNNVRAANPNSKVNLMIYYQSKKTSNLVMKNSVDSESDDLKKTNVVYEFKCPMSHDQVASYIGITQNSLSRRLTLHLQNGSIKQHYLQYHNKEITRKEIVDNTKIIKMESNRYRLLIKEALLIQQKGPIINKQFDCFPNILKLYYKTDKFTKADKFTKTSPAILKTDFDDGISITSTPIPDTTLDVNQRVGVLLSFLY